MKEDDFTGERIVPDNSPQRIIDDHIERYQFAVTSIQGKKVLDIACGTGYGSHLMKQNGAKEVIGVDISEEAISFASNKYDMPYLQYIVGNASRLNFPDNYFDAVVSFETIEHVQDYKKFLAEIFRVLKQDGLLIISSPNRKITSSRFSVTHKPANPYHVIEFTWKEFIDLLEQTYKGISIFGQRHVFFLFANRFIKGILRRCSKLLKIDLIDRIYQHADGPQVKPLRSFHEPRYVIAVCKK